MEFKTASLTNEAMFGLIASGESQTPAAWYDGSYKYYSTNANRAGKFPKAWTFIEADSAGDLMELDINVSGFVIATVGGVVKTSFQGVVADYGLVVTANSLKTYTDVCITHGLNA
jgi:hypothetical protein